MIVKEESGLLFQIFNDTSSAKVKFTSKSIGDIFIPRFVKDGSKEYPIVVLFGNLKKRIGNKVISVNFPEDSEVQIIDQNALGSTKIKKLIIPASIKELKEGWCLNTPDLYEVIISPNNSNFSNFDKRIIIGKSTLENESLDSLYFASRNIFQVTIPSFIKRIAPYAFSDCKYLKFVNFPENSSLEIIGSNSFSQSKILSVTIPNSVKIIGKNAFEDCTNLSKIKISEDSELESIGSLAFANTSIDHLHFPPKLKELQSGWCKSMKKLHSISISPKNQYFSIIEEKLIVGKSNPKNDDYDILYYILPGLKKLILPSNIKKINDFAFLKSKKLKFLQIPEDSKLEVIGKYAFYKSNIKSIDIPKYVTVLDDFSFARSSLEEINFVEDSNLEIIGKNAFRSSSLTRIKVPKHVHEIRDNAFEFCDELREILFCDDDEIEDIGEYAFKNTSITKIEIPKKLKILKKGTFERCNKLEEISFSEPSETMCIGKDVFSDSSIKRITFPSRLSKLERGWNKNTCSLNHIDIPNDNQHFKMIENGIFISKTLSYQEPKHYDIQDRSCSDDDDYNEDQNVSEYDENSLLMKSQNSDSSNGKDGNTFEKIFDVISFVPRNIKKVEIPKYIKYIDSYAFSSCEELEEVSIPKDSELLELEPKSFLSSSLSSIFIPAQVKLIGDKCFNKCSELKSVEFDINSHLEIIGKKSFSSMKIDQVSIPYSVKIIRKDAFKADSSNSKNNTEISPIPENSQLQTLNEGVISLRSKEAFKLPNHVKTIKGNAFKSCYDLKILYISEESELTTIEDKAFYNCSIKSFYFPPLLKNINNFLVDLHKLTEISVSPKNKYYSTINDGKIILGKTDINSDNFNVLLYSTRNIKYVIIPSYIKKINSKAFAHCEKIRKVEFEDNSELEIIGKKSFKKSSIEYIVIPDSVVIIDEYAFSKCKYLRKVKISEKSRLTFIGRSAFYYTDIDKIFIPKYVQVIDKGAFMESSLEYICFAKDSLLNKIGSSAFNRSKVYHVTIPKHVKIIEDHTFIYCKDLYKIDFEEDSDLQIIQQDAFTGSRISKLNFPPKLRELEDGWACDVKELKSIKISPTNEKFKNIDKKMIVEKSNPNNDQFDVLTFVLRDADTITIPSCIKVIKTEAFSYCKNLKEIKFAENSELEIIDNYAFNYLSCKSNLQIPKSVRIIGDYSFAHSNITSIEFPNDSLLEQIGNNAFYESKIKKFVFPNKIKNVTFDIFENCNKLEEIQMSDNIELIDPNIKNTLPIKTINIPAKIDDFNVIKSFPNIENISISPKNKYFGNFEGKLIVKKVNPNNDAYDTIFYAMKNIGDITMPSYLTKIDESIFSYRNIEKVSFLDDSLLKAILDSAFEYSTITEICIPKHVKIIGSKSFSHCSNLKKVEFVNDSELEIIKSSSFKDSSLITIDIPKSVKIIENFAFLGSKLQTINFHEDSKLELIGYSAFRKTFITKMEIPKKVEILKGGTFGECKNLEEISFSEPSETMCIGKDVFSDSSIKRITFPSCLSKLERGWNKNTGSLNQIDIPNDNHNFKMIEGCIIISKILSYQEPKLYYCRTRSSSDNDDDDDDDENSSECDENTFEKEEENKNQEDEKIFDVICFAPRNTKNVRIPKYIKYIDSYAFSNCEELEEVSIPKDSELLELEPKSFLSSSLSSIFIPTQVKFIGDKCFNDCKKLSKVEIASDREISIHDDAFASTALRGFSFPKGYSSYDDDIFGNCYRLKSIEFLCDGQFELAKNDIINRVFLLSFPNAQSIHINKPRYNDNEKEVIIFAIPFVKINYSSSE